MLSQMARLQINIVENVMKKTTQFKVDTCLSIKTFVSTSLRLKDRLKWFQDSKRSMLKASDMKHLGKFFLVENSFANTNQSIEMNV